MSHENRRQMFSGIVEEVGEVTSMEFNRTVKMWDGSFASGLEMVVRSKVATEDAYIGCSIAVNGVCLTATELHNDKFTVAVSPETIRRTNLGKLQSGRYCYNNLQSYSQFDFSYSFVNIERALQPNGRNSGHFVQGHVDCTAKVLEKWFEGDSLWVKLSIDDEFIRYIVPKGFISLDGTSLTICQVHNQPQKNWFTIMLVPHTQQSVIFSAKQIGDEINVEVDILGKLVERSLASNLDRVDGQVKELKKELEEKSRKINELSLVVDDLIRRVTGRSS